jgi:hypothetical protein
MGMSNTVDPRSRSQAVNMKLTHYQRVRASLRWEVYGDWNDDPRLLRTEVCYLFGTQAQQDGLLIKRRR